MAFAGHCGLDVKLPAGANGAAGALFSEELGVVLQVKAAQLAVARGVLGKHGLGELTHDLGSPTREMRVRIEAATGRIDESWQDLRRAWSETSYRMRELRDEPGCAREEFAAAYDTGAPGLNVALTFDPHEDIAAPYVGKTRPKVAVLREQGVNSQVEMAAAFDRAGFTAVDVHMTDLIDRAGNLDGFQGLVACGGFSYGDVLGAGEGWAKSILFNARVRAIFLGWFERTDRFTLGVCNGCQMLAALAEVIPGATHWPRFRRNRSEQFEGRLSMVEVADTNSLFFAGMAGSRLPIAVAHGEGRAEFRDAAAEAASRKHVALRFVDNGGRIATRYPSNPNGSPEGIAGLASADGRVTILMPHPERVFRTVQNSWHPPAAGEDSGWMRIFRNARVWVG
jgi:phosphoribosylformylglycinamidine synthase